MLYMYLVVSLVQKTAICGMSQIEAGHVLSDIPDFQCLVPAMSLSPIKRFSSPQRAARLPAATGYSPRAPGLGVRRSVASEVTVSSAVVTTTISVLTLSVPVSSISTSSGKVCVLSLDTIIANKL